MIFMFGYDIISTTSDGMNTEIFKFFVYFIIIKNKNVDWMKLNYVLFKR